MPYPLTGMKPLERVLSNRHLIATVTAPGDELARPAPTLIAQ